LFVGIHTEWVQGVRCGVWGKNPNPLFVGIHTEWVQGGIPADFHAECNSTRQTKCPPPATTVYQKQKRKMPRSRNDIYIRKQKGNVYQKKKEMPPSFKDSVSEKKRIPYI